MKRDISGLTELQSLDENSPTIHYRSYSHNDQHLSIDIPQIFFEFDCVDTIVSVIISFLSLTRDLEVITAFYFYFIKLLRCFSFEYSVTTLALRVDRRLGVSSYAEIYLSYY